MAKRRKKRKKNPSLGSVFGFIGGTIVSGLASFGVSLLTPDSATPFIPVAVNAGLFLAIKNDMMPSVTGDTKTGALWAYGVWGTIAGVGMIARLARPTTPSLNP